MKKTTFTILAFGTVAIAASMLTACMKDNPDSPGYEFMPDMYRSQSYETNGMEMHIDSMQVMDSATKQLVWKYDTTWMANQLAPEGSIPLGFTPFPYANNAQGDSLASKFWKNPNQVTEAYEKQGEELYNKYCIYCHGQKGDGKGKLVESGKYPNQPPSYIELHDSLKLTDGHVYHVITYGKGVMGSHASQLTNEERWKVISYVKKLGRGGKSIAEASATKATTDTAKADSAAAKPMQNKVQQ
jgi:mono/diheme cytochrome c family protein